MKEPDIKVKPPSKVCKTDYEIPSSKAKYHNESDIFNKKDQEIKNSIPIRSYHLESNIFNNNNKGINSDKGGIQGYHNQSDIFHTKESNLINNKVKKSDINRETINDPIIPEKSGKKYIQIKSSVFNENEKNELNNNKNTSGQKVSEDNTLAHDFTGIPMREIRPGKKFFEKKISYESKPEIKRGIKISKKKFEEDPRSLLAHNFTVKPLDDIKAGK